MDFVRLLDPSKLVLAGTAIAFFISIFASPSYNLPIFLFGCYAQENTEALQSLQTFTGLLGISMIFDIIWMAKNDQHGFARFLSISLLILKLPTFFAFANSLRQRGSQFGGIGSSGGPTVWSMPGGFTSGGGEGYQTVDDEPFIRNTSRPAAPPHRTPIPTTAEPAAPGAYQSIV